MARIRTVKPEFFTSADIVELEPLTRLLFIALWCESDREGRFEWRPKTLKLRYLPGDNCDTEAMLNELIESGLVVKYEVDGVAYGCIPTFTEHQVINNRESESSIPELVSEDLSRVTTRQSGVKAEGKEGKEGNGRTRAIKFQTYIDECNEASVDPIPETARVFSYAEEAGIPREYLNLCWLEFHDKYLEKDKRYKDWPAVFLNCVRENWYGLWYVDDGGGYALTKNGKQANLAQGVAA